MTSSDTDSNGDGYVYILSGPQTEGPDNMEWVTLDRHTFCNLFLSAKWSFVWRSVPRNVMTPVWILVADNWERVDTDDFEGRTFIIWRRLLKLDN